MVDDVSRIYVSGPMRGYPDLNRAEFTRATALLREMGHDVFSPSERDAKINTPLDLLDHVAWGSVMAEDLREVMAADAVVMLTGWLWSQGACLERVVAESTGREVLVLGQRWDDYRITWVPCLIPADPWDHGLVFSLARKTPAGVAS